MVLPPYISFKTDYVYICSTREPHYIFRVQNTQTEYKVVGYSIWLEFAGTLAGNRLLLGEDIDKLVIDALTFWQDRVHNEPQRYKKYKF